MKKKITILALSITLILAVIVLAVGFTLGWFPSASTELDKIGGDSEGYFVVACITDENNVSGTLLPAVTDNPNAVRNGLPLNSRTVTSGAFVDSYDVTTKDGSIFTGTQIATAAKKTTFQSTFKYYNRGENPTDSITLELTPQVYITEDETDIYFSTTRDIAVDLTITIDFGEEEKDYTITLNSADSTHSAPYYTLVVADECEISLQASCYYLQIDELVAPALRDASDIFVKFLLKDVTDRD